MSTTTKHMEKTNPKNKLRIKILSDIVEFKSMSTEEVDENRLKAYLSFDEEEIVSNTENFEYTKYLNKNGEMVECKILLRRGNGEIIVINNNGCKVCLTEGELIK